jgi:hypothetical protein
MFSYCLAITIKVIVSRMFRRNVALVFMSETTPDLLTICTILFELLLFAFKIRPNPLPCR